MSLSQLMAGPTEQNLTTAQFDYAVAHGWASRSRCRAFAPRIPLQLGPLHQGPSAVANAAAIKHSVLADPAIHAHRTKRMRSEYPALCFMAAYLLLGLTFCPPCSR